VEQRERGASDSAAARQRGKERREKVGVRAWGCHAAQGAVGPSPDRRTAPGNGPSAALAGDVRRVRIAGGNREGREASDGWVAAQYRAAVPLTGGASLSAGVGRAWAWARGCANALGLAREETEMGRPDAQ
jgi:hypothetical protein